MNYSEKAKNDILKNLESESSLCFAFVCAITKCLGNMAIYKEGYALEYEIKQENIALQVLHSLKDLFDVEIEFCCKSSLNKSYTLKIVGQNANNILKKMGLSHYDDAKFVWTSGVEMLSGLTNRRLAQSYMQGVFLSVGSIYMPDDILDKGGYQIEMLFAEEDYAIEIETLLKSCGLQFQTMDRGNSFVVYCKNGEVISDFLAFVHAMNTVIELSTIMMKREVNNNINRQSNFYAANSDKIADALISVIQAIEKIENMVGLDILGDKLKDIALERKKNHQESLGELAVRLNISKTTLSRNLTKIKNYAEGLGNA